jgi:hypothetical protein
MEIGRDRQFEGIALHPLREEEDLEALDIACLRVEAGDDVVWRDESAEDRDDVRRYGVPARQSVRRRRTTSGTASGSWTIPP